GALLTGQGPEIDGIDRGPELSGAARQGLDAEVNERRLCCEDAAPRGSSQRIGQVGVYHVRQSRQCGMHANEQLAPTRAGHELGEERLDLWQRRGCRVCGRGRFLVIGPRGWLTNL